MEDDGVKRIDIKEFRALGFLQEANRKFFHPLGLALEVVLDEKGEERLGGVWDYRDAPEGMLFGEEMISKDKIENIESLRLSKLDVRIEKGCDNNGVQQFI